MKIEKVICLNCGKEFFIDETNIQKDNLGEYVNCSSCNGTFDINKITDLRVSDLLELCQWGNKEKKITLLVNFMENGEKKSFKTFMIGEYYIVDEVLFSQVNKDDTENTPLTTKDFINLMEKECENCPNDWGNLYTSPMEHLGGCEIRFNYNVYNNFDEDLLKIKKIEVVNDEIIIVLEEKAVTEDTDYYIVDNQKIDICLLETIYNWYIQKNCGDKYFDYMVTPKRKEELKEFVEKIKKQNIIVKIFDNYRDLIEYVLIEGKDKEQLIDSFEKMIGTKYHLTDDNNILEINGKYIYMLY